MDMKKTELRRNAMTTSLWSTYKGLAGVVLIGLLIFTADTSAAAGLTDGIRCDGDVRNTYHGGPPGKKPYWARFRKQCVAPQTADIQAQWTVRELDKARTNGRKLAGKPGSGYIH